MRKHAGNIVLLLLSVILSLVAGEFIIGRGQLVTPIQSGWVWRNAPLRTLQPPSADREINEMALRGRRFAYSDLDFVVLLVGDSQVEAAASVMALMPEVMLQDRLSVLLNKPVKVFSLAASGWGQDQQVLAMEKYFRSHRADLVAVWATPINDFWENTFPDRSVTAQAGHFKPTFRLRDDRLEGPFFEADFYAGNSALYHALLKATTDTPLAQDILDHWIAALPPALNPQDSSPNCDGAVAMPEDSFMRDIFELDMSRRYLLDTPQDAASSRSHYAPYTIPASARDRYEKQVTRALFQKMSQVAKENAAIFRVFYPVREDWDKNWRAIACVRTADHRLYAYSPDFLKLLQETTPADEFIFFDIEGKNENVVSKNDRHLNSTGNRKVMENLAREVAAIITPKP